MEQRRDIICKAFDMASILMDSPALQADFPVEIIDPRIITAVSEVLGETYTLPGDPTEDYIVSEDEDEESLNSIDEDHPSLILLDNDIELLQGDIEQAKLQEEGDEAYIADCLSECSSPIRKRRESVPSLDDAASVESCQMVGLEKGCEAGTLEVTFRTSEHPSPDQLWQLLADRLKLPKAAKMAQYTIPSAQGFSFTLAGVDRSTLMRGGNSFTWLPQ